MPSAASAASACQRWSSWATSSQERVSSTDKEKVQAVREWPAPTNSTEVASFLGLANFYRRFIKDFSTTAFALTELTKKDKSFEWSAEAQTSFEALKTSLCEAPVLAPPNRDEPLHHRLRCIGVRHWCSPLSGGGRRPTESWLLRAGS